jgi:hypothetical protein
MLFSQLWLQRVLSSLMWQSVVHQKSIRTSSFIINNYGGNRSFVKTCRKYKITIPSPSMLPSCGVHHWYYTTRQQNNKTTYINRSFISIQKKIPSPFKCKENRSWILGYLLFILLFIDYILLSSKFWLLIYTSSCLIRVFTSTMQALIQIKTKQLHALKFKTINTGWNHSMVNILQVSMTSLKIHRSTALISTRLLSQYSSLAEYDQGVIIIFYY